MNRRRRVYIIALAAVWLLIGCVGHPKSARPASVGPADCYDRERSPHTFVVDAHNHFRPFGGRAIPFPELNDYFLQTGVRYVNIFGIGQMVPPEAECTYYLDCPGTPVRPTIRNDFANAASYVEFKPHRGVHMTLAMTFMDLSRPETITDLIHLYDKAYPNLFRWVGEVNMVKQALFKNHHRPVTEDDIDRWADFMALLRNRRLPITFHSDLGNDLEPTKYLHLMAHVLMRYPENPIVWAHMGLSKELTTMDPAEHIAVVSVLLDAHPNLLVDVSWRVLDDAYFSKPEVREQYIAFFNTYPDRVLGGTDFVASRNKDVEVYKRELAVTSRIFQYVDDTAFRHIVLGETYFRLLGLNVQAPPICEAAAP